MTDIDQCAHKGGICMLYWILNVYGRRTYSSTMKPRPRHLVRSYRIFLLGATCCGRIAALSALASVNPDIDFCQGLLSFVTTLSFCSSGMPSSYTSSFQQSFASFSCVGLDNIVRIQQVTPISRKLLKLWHELRRLISPGWVIMRGNCL